MNQFQNLLEATQYFKDEDVCRKYLEQLIWNGTPKCPHCESTKVYHLKDGKNYKCANKECKSIFNVKVGTYLENTKIPLRKWMHAIFIFASHKKGISSYQLARDISVSQKCAWFLLSRIRGILTDKAPFMFDSITEIDETYMGGKAINMHASKKEYDVNGELIENKTPVLGIVDRDGHSTLIPLKKATKKQIFSIINERIKQGSTVVTDSYTLYHSLKEKYNHHSVDHSAKEYVRGIFHTNTVEGFFSHLKRGIYGVYHQASEKHLHRYCNEFSFRYNTRKNKEVERFNIALTQMTGRLTWNELTKKS
ncbi:MAG: IS1595 family transposase [Bacteroidia bacterium]